LPGVNTPRGCARLTPIMPPIVPNIAVRKTKVEKERESGGPKDQKGCAAWSGEENTPDRAGQGCQPAGKK